MHKLFDFDDSEEYTPIHSSAVYPVWQHAAQETAKKLAGVNSIEGRLLFSECCWFQDVFASWSPRNKPDDVTRRRMINEFEIFVKKVNNLVGVQNVTK